MLGKIRKKLKGKKGFTLVELIVVIVIILVLAAALVPQLLKYVDQARRANCQSEAATLLAQVQADYTAMMAKDQTGMNITFTGAGYVVQGVTINQVINLTGSNLTAKNAEFTVSTATNNDHYQEINKFAYSNGDYVATWTVEEAWKIVKQGATEMEAK